MISMIILAPNAPSPAIYLLLSPIEKVSTQENITIITTIIIIIAFVLLLLISCK